MLIRNLLVAGLAFVAVGMQDATAAVIKCNACTPDDYDHAARAEGPGRHVVYDLYHDRAAGFEVHWDAKASEWKVTPNEVPAALANLFGKLAAYHRTGAGNQREIVRVTVAQLGVPHTETATAYDLLHDAVLRKGLLDRLARGLPEGTWSRPMQEVFEAAHALGVTIPSVTDPYGVEAVVEFAGSSKMTFQLVPGRADLVEESGRAANGEPLLERNRSDYAGTYHFDDAATLSAFLRQASHLGIAVTGAGDSVVACRPERRKLSCTRS